MNKVYAKRTFNCNYFDQNFKTKTYTYIKYNCYDVIDENDLLILVDKVIFSKKTEFTVNDDNIKYFSVYFYTEQEMRKIKLEKLYGSCLYKEA